MKKRSLVITAAVLMGLILLLATPVPDIMFGLLFGGAIPGTDLTIPWFVMFITYLATAVVVVLWSRRQQLYLGSPKVAKAQAEFMAKNMPAKPVAVKKKPVTAVAAKSKSRSRRSYSRA